jgi:CheY-like chemotaxis protein
MTYNYLYIDDAEDSVRESFAKTLSGDGIQITTIHVSDLVLEDTDKITENINKYDGLLLDLRLDEMSQEGKKRTPFTATVYAQHIRSMVTNGILTKDVPIVLFSTDDKLQKVYSVDLTSQDLFDRYIEKTKIPSNAKLKLFSLSHGYQIINSNKNLNEIIGLKTLEDIDERIFARFSENATLIPTHEYAQTILKDLIYISGPLINELTLAARLGIDIEKSDGWAEVKKYFQEAKYTGVFSDGWDRWWVHLIDDIFYANTNTYLSYLDGLERVELIKKVSKIENIITAKPLEKNHSTRFWTYCKVLEKPLDPLEGFKIYTAMEPKPWQDYEYCSLISILEQKHKEKNITIHSCDKERLSLILSEY